VDVEAVVANISPMALEVFPPVINSLVAREDMSLVWNWIPTMDAVDPNRCSILAMGAEAVPLDVGEVDMAILVRGMVEEVVLAEVGSSEVVLCQFNLRVEMFTAGLQMEGLPLWWSLDRVWGGSGTSSVTPEVSNVVDLLQQAITTAIGNGSAARPVPDNTVEQIVSLLQQSVGKSHPILNSMGNSAGPNLGSQHSSKLETIKELSNPTHLDDKVGSSVISISKEKVSFCFRCKTKGHQLSDCNIELFCEIYDVKTHLTSKCPVVCACKTFAIPCGVCGGGIGVLLYTPTQSSKAEARWLQWYSDYCEGFHEWRADFEWAKKVGGCWLGLVCEVCGEQWACLVQLFLTSFSKNLAVGRIWLWGKSEYHYDYVCSKIKLFIGLRI
jgi:hypothetical protein